MTLVVVVVTYVRFVEIAKIAILSKLVCMEDEN